MRNFVDLAQVLATFIAAIGLWITGVQFRRTVTQKRIEQVTGAFHTISADKDLWGLYYKIEYGAFEYNERFHGSDDERNLDRILTILDSVARQVELRLLKVEDLELIAYEYLMIYQNTGVNNYLEQWLDGWFQEKEINIKPYGAFRRIGETLKKRNFTKRHKQMSQ